MRFRHPDAGGRSHRVLQHQSRQLLHHRGCERSRGDRRRQRGTGLESHRQYVRLGRQHREVLARNSASINDTVAQWQDLPLISGSTGTLQGLVTDPGGNPLMGIRVSAGPHQVMTSWDGSYRVSGVPSGPIEITFQADNGEYLHARMSATVSSSGATTANATLTAATVVGVTFQVTVPASTPQAAIPRLYGDT